MDTQPGAIGRDEGGAKTRPDAPTRDEERAERRAAAAGLGALATQFAQGESLAAGRIVPAPTLLRFGGRLSAEGGGDVPTTWARRPRPTGSAASE